MTTETPCHICGQEQSNHIGAYRACPVPAEPQGCIICGNVLTEGGEPYCWDHQPEPPACKCGGGNRVPNVAHTPDGCYSVPAAPQGSEGSEPPIDHRFEGMYAAWKAEQAISAALRAERDALKHDVACLETKIGVERRAGEAAIAENADLKAEVSRLQREMAGSLPSILHAEGGESKP